MEISKGKLVNEIDDKQEYSKTYPQLNINEVMKSSMKGALHEIHIFLLPLNPDQSLIQKAVNLAQEFNDKKVGDLQSYTMKMCYLSLVFRGVGPVKVLQSARYYASDNMNEVIQQAYIDSDWYRKNGFDVIRVKIESNAHCNVGVPQTDEQACQYPKYFEHHIKVKHKTATIPELISWAESEQLIKISEQFSREMKTPVPVSWNNLPNEKNPDNPGFQRFLNIRFRKLGLNNIKKHLNKLEELIKNQTNFQVVKSIDEYVWYDTYTQLDHGWIDFNPEEIKQIVE